MGVGVLLQPSVGLREAEIRLATRTIKRGLPCLQLFPTGPDTRAHDRHADIYDSFADMFTVLSVCPRPSPFLSQSGYPLDNLCMSCLWLCAALYGCGGIKPPLDYFFS